MMQQQPVIRGILPNLISTVTAVSSVVSYSYVPATVKATQSVGAAIAAFCVSQPVTSYAKSFIYFYSLDFFHALKLLNALSNL